MIGRRFILACTTVLAGAAALLSTMDGSTPGAPTAVAAAVIASPSASPDPTPSDPYAVVRGMTISCPGSGRIWGSDQMVDAMAELRDLGVNWITIHPYAGIRSDGSVVMSRMYDDPYWLTRPIREAHRLGLKIMIKPHIAYWGSEFSWRGEIAFDTDEEWRTFFDSYEAWVKRVAMLTDAADAFVVGTELEKTTHFEDEWRRIIRSVREVTDVPLTYSANWDRYEKVPFWDALDVIGIQSYFPLVNHTNVPSQEELDRAWASVLSKLEVFAAEHDRRIILGELGYNRSALAASRPWEYRTGGENAEIIQQRCLRAALKALSGSDAVVGAFLWKWFPGDRRRGNFLLTTPTMRQVIAECWRQREEAPDATAVQ